MILKLVKYGNSFVLRVPRIYILEHKLKLGQIYDVELCPVEPYSNESHENDDLFTEMKEAEITYAQMNSPVVGAKDDESVKGGVAK